LAHDQNQTVIVVPAFQNRFAGPNERVVEVTAVSPTGSSSALIPVAGNSVGQSQTGTRQVQVLDASTMNIPAFPGPATIQNGNATVTVFPSGIGFVPATNFLGQATGFGQNLNDISIPTSAVPGPATNALPRPAAPNGIGQPAVNGTISGQQALGVPVTPGAPVVATPSTVPRAPGGATPTGAVPAPAAPARTR